MRQDDIVDHNDTIRLPSQYHDALALADSMRLAAERQDWNEVRQLRTELPRLASELDNAWQLLRTDYPEACALLEPTRIRMIREILRVDEQIRQLGSTSYRRLSPWLATSPMHAVPLYENLASPL